MKIDNGFLSKTGFMVNFSIPENPVVHSVHMTMTPGPETWSHLVISVQVFATNISHFSCKH